MTTCKNRNWHSDLLRVFSIIGVLAHGIFYCENHALAQIPPDGTLGNNSSIITPNVNIKGLPADRIDGGATRGANLFHSFREFNVRESRRVYFANPAGIKNILTRVTGSNVSNILGTLGVDGGANLFFINPNGILFGDNARLDVAGSFVGTTANSFVFGNGLEFSATNPQTPSPLLTVNPSALLFNQLQAGRIENRSIAPAGIDPAGLNAFGLRVGDGKSLLLVGGNVSMDGGKLNAYGGRVELGGLAAPGNVNLLFNGDNLSLKFPDNVTRASVSLINQARVYVEAAGGGDIAINARNVEILGESRLYAGIGGGLGTPETVAGDITLNATGYITIAGSGSGIGNFVGEGAKGKGGNITIDSGEFSLRDGAQLFASILGQGNAGNVTVGAKNTVSLAGNAYIFSTVEAGGVGKGGNIDINAISLSLTNGAQLSASTYGQGNAGNVTVGAKNAVSLAGNAYIFSTVEAGGVGKGGNIDINAISLSLTNGAQLLTSTRAASDTKPAGQGNAGNVNLKVIDVVDIAGKTGKFSSGILSDVGTGTIGNGGNITIDSGSFSLRDGAQLVASTSGQGNAGNINLKVKGVVNIAGETGNVSSGILSDVGTGTVGNGGNITIDSGSFSLRDGTQLVASTSGQGNAGNINLKVKGVVNIAGFSSGILTTVEAGGVGKGGNIDINAATLSLTDGAQLLTITSRASDTQPAGRGDAGNVNVKVTGVVDIAGEKNGFASGIRSFLASGAVGNGGNIFIDSDNFSLQDGAQLSASTFGQGNSGNVTVSAKNAVFLTGGQTTILSTVEAAGVGKGGNININAATLSLTDGAQLLASTRGASDTQPAGRGDAGNVNLKVTGVIDIAGEKNGFVSGIFSRVETGTVGNGGNIFIDSGDFSLRDGAQLQASTSGVGNAGNVTVGAKNAVSLIGSGIFSTVEAGGVSKGGNININAATLSLTNGAQLLTSTRGASDTKPAGQGNAGNVNVKVTGAVDIAGEKNDLKSGIFSAVETGTVGNGGNIFINSANFSLRDGAQLSASTYGQGNAGNVTVNAKNAVSLIGSGILSTVEAGGVGKGGNIDINAATLSLTDGGQLLTISRASDTQLAGRRDAGNVNVKITGAVDIAGEKNGLKSGIFSRVETGTVGNGGNIFIDSGNFSLRDGALLSALTLGQVGNGGNIFIDSANFSLQNGAQLSASTYGQGNAGNVTVNAKNAVSLADTYILSTVEAGGVGKGGNIEINAATLSFTDGAQLLTITRGAFDTQPAGRGDAGNVNVKVTGVVDIAGQKNGFSSGIFSAVQTGTVGNGGNITIDSGDFSLRDGAQLGASTFGVGNAGNVTVGAKNTVSLAGQPTAIFSTVEAGGVGKGGNIDINAANLSLTDSAGLLTITRGAFNTQPAGRGDAGNVNVKVTGAVDIAGEKNGFASKIASNVETGTVGNGGNITIDSGDFSLRDGARLSALTSGQGNAGNIRINAKDAVTVSGTSQESGDSSALFTSTNSTSTGIGGDITVNTNIFRISNGALLDARTRNDRKGGNITVNTNIFDAFNGGQLTATTSSNGGAGKITVNADDKVIINGINPSYNNLITKFPNKVQNIGANSGLFVSSTGSGITGDIEINSPKITLDNQGKLNAESASGNGGNINVNSDLLLLRRNSQISTNAGTEKLGGNGGNINIKSRFIVAVPNENSDISANAFTGIGGRVDITTNGIFGILRQKRPTENSDITASSELGVSGEVTINSPDTDPSRGLIQLPSNLIDASQQIAQGCTPRGRQNANRFIATGRGGLPQSPNEPLRGRAVITGWVDLPAQATAIADKSSIASMTKSTDRIVEAQGWIVDANGNIMLVAQSVQSSSIPSAISCSQ